MDIVGFPGMVVGEGLLVDTVGMAVIMEGVGSMAPPEVFHRGRRLRRHLQAKFRRCSGEGNKYERAWTEAVNMTAVQKRKSFAHPLLTRRQAIAFLGATGAAWLMGEKPAFAQAPAGTSRSLCIVRPEQTEGPYFIDERLHRFDIRADPTDQQMRPGTPLTLTFQVMRLTPKACIPLPDAQVDLWHCDAAGVYSNVQDPGFNTIGKKFLRGYQMTNAQGTARFLTIYPGWYPIRTVHIHFKIRTAPIARRSFEFTSQVYFPDELTDHVHTVRPYSVMGTRRVRNPQDFIFRDGGDRLLLEPAQTNDGYTATFPIALQLP
jgi:protocatechuate 3,4-dioxygenase beta subunit